MIAHSRLMLLFCKHRERAMLSEISVDLYIDYLLLELSAKRFLEKKNYKEFFSMASYKNRIRKEVKEEVKDDKVTFNRDILVLECIISEQEIL